MRTATWIKSGVAGLAIIIGGPMLMNYVTPSEEELFKRYNPELQKRSLEGRDQRLKDANEFIDRLKEYSKSDKPIWTVIKEVELEEKRRRKAEEAARTAERKSIAAELRKQRLDDDSK